MLSRDYSLSDGRMEHNLPGMKLAQRVVAGLEMLLGEEEKNTPVMTKNISLELSELSMTGDTTDVRGDDIKLVIKAKSAT